jgi:hypothetical protein
MAKKPIMSTLISPPRKLYMLAYSCAQLVGMDKCAMIIAALKLFIKDVKTRYPDAFNEDAI